MVASTQHQLFQLQEQPTSSSAINHSPWPVKQAPELICHALLLCISYPAPFVLQEYAPQEGEDVEAGAATADQCLTPPGFYLPSDGGDMQECPTGTYKEVNVLLTLPCSD